VKAMKNSEQLMEIRSAEVGPTVLILAGVHGDEYEPMIAAAQLKAFIGNNLKKGIVRIMPIVNRSAFKIGARCGEDGLDLARICPGDVNGSISMQYAAMAAEEIQKCDYLIDLHTGGQLFDLYPLAGYMLHEDKTVLAKQRKMARAFGLPLIWGTDPLPEGRTLSVARDYQIPAIYVEFGGPGPVRAKVIDAYIQGCLNILRDLDMLDFIPKSRKRPKYVVEDSTPGGGYLQGKMAAPYDAVFEPTVQVGEQIKAGDRWGIIYDVDTLNPKDILADMDGIVLFIRSIPLVKKGESLGGILKINA